MTSFVPWLTALWIHTWWLPAGWLPAGPASADAEVVVVDGRRPIGLQGFDCQAIGRSAVVNRLCHDARAGIVVAQIHGTYRRYCGMTPERVREWLGADSMGRFHATFVDGRFPCPKTGDGPAAWNARGVGSRVAML